LDPIGGERSPAFSGGNIDGWDAPALTALLHTPKPWNREQLAHYLRHGWSPEHGAAAGPMGPVAHSLSQVPPADTDAIATYIMSLQKPVTGAPAAVPAAVPAASPQNASGNAAVPQGAALFAGACAGCHSAAAPMMAAGGRPSLALSSAVTGARPDNLIQTMLNGIPWSHTGQHTFMPPFAASLTDAQIASIAAYVRSDIGKQPAWPDVEQRVTRIRKENQQ
jgi:mono/diheme cytochrome c family protein